MAFSWATALMADVAAIAKTETASHTWLSVYLKMTAISTGITVVIAIKPCTKAMRLMSCTYCVLFMGLLEIAH